MLITDMEFVQNFTPPDFQAKNFTPSISPNFNSFSKKKHKKWVKMEKFTPLAKNLHCCWQWRQWQISPLAPRVLVGAPWGLVQHFSQDCLGFLSPQVPRCVFPCHFLAQKGIKRELFWHHDLYIMGPCVWLECWMIICAGEFAVKALLRGYVYCLNGICLGCASVNIKINIYSTPVQEI